MQNRTTPVASRNCREAKLAYTGCEAAAVEMLGMEKISRVTAIVATASAQRFGRQVVPGKNAAIVVC
jgi:hypothetical protein